MTDQWQELKETIIELRDSNGTGTQQEVCKFLANYMDILEKQMQEPCDDAISRALNKIMDWLEQEPKTGRWWERDTYPQECECWDCSECQETVFERTNYCPNCGAKMIDPQERNEG